MTVLEELQPKLASLLHRRGYRLIDERRDESFGNAAVVVDCEAFLLRVVRDRGDTVIELSQIKGASWHSAENILEFIAGNSTADLADRLEANFQQVADLLASDLNQRGYTAFEKKKAEAMLQRLFPKSLSGPR
jgi:hypothetical protein